MVLRMMKNSLVSMIVKSVLKSNLIIKSNQATHKKKSFKNQKWKLSQRTLLIRLVNQILDLYRKCTCSLN